MRVKSCLTNVRLAKGMTLAQLGKKVGLTASGIHRIETRGATRASTGLKLAQALNTPPYVLFPDIFTKVACQIVSGAKLRPLHRRKLPR